MKAYSADDSAGDYEYDGSYHVDSSYDPDVQRHSSAKRINLNTGAVEELVEPDTSCL